MGMFYCDPCADKYGYPKHPKEHQSFGPCECCGKTAGCTDIPCSQLPEPKKPKAKTKA